LGETADHAAADAADEGRGAGGAGVVFCFRGDEEEDGALGGSLNPGPRDQTLVDLVNVRECG